MITLIRHGQAGSRLAYDDLSDTGCEQARALGTWLREQGRQFDSVIAGGLERQQKTARELIAAHASQAELQIDERWSEFDLDAVYNGIAPLLAREDENFRIEYEELQREVRNPASSAHRMWRNCDVTVVRAWIEERHRFEGETFDAFSQRVRSGLEAIPPDGDVAVITSATPIALCMSFALDLAPRRVMQLAGALRNASFTEIAIRPDGVRLVSFNNVSHLTDARLLTVR